MEQGGKILPLKGSVYNLRIAFALHHSKNECLFSKQPKNI